MVFQIRIRWLPGRKAFVVSYRVGGRKRIKVIARCGLKTLQEARAKAKRYLGKAADDQRADTISAWGNPHIRTPNIDSLVKRGFSFRRNYCMGSWPL